ncbi:hypothetical protein EGY07_01020 [Chryseobacterium indologenes]|uniref:hypothetical protein n=1 Tax=Chryseobacterium indologenes TaxID=253 RepID=UPI000B515334|nr:hypothetical protein [Chryseobacterium indologenes]ASE62854.1 hypothetical protein CEQ15_15830 [Chryseobacterium indologenes]AYZ34242.1 hypothetical protein EGY07_01020 [Chryseobacterium indologenes]MBF6642765.1 hypothetical protein [Chryseobacterium indologenes]MEB4762320.1 hypothetical protein [Chryseobacterium indologenes]QQQ69185.1 hypothetical protein JHW31_11665 [Chryseobacterium indologenes]
MKTFIQLLSFISYASALGIAVYVLRELLKKVLYYPPNTINSAKEKLSKHQSILGLCFPLSIACIIGSKALIKHDFQKMLKENKIILVEVNGFPFAQEDGADLFTKFEEDPGRFHCESYSGNITFENNESIPIEVIQHCYEENKYIIVSKKYSTDATIGIITTSKFQYIKNKIPSEDQ